MDENPYKSPTARPKRTVFWIVIAIVVLVVALPIIIVSGLNLSAKPEPFIFMLPPEN